MCWARKFLRIKSSFEFFSFSASVSQKSPMFETHEIEMSRADTWHSLQFKLCYSLSLLKSPRSELPIRRAYFSQRKPASWKFQLRSSSLEVPISSKRPVFNAFWHVRRSNKNGCAQYAAFRALVNNASNTACKQTIRR